METADTVIAVLSNHQAAAEEAVEELSAFGFAMRSPASRPVLSRTALLASRSRQTFYRLRDLVEPWTPVIAFPPRSAVARV